MAAALLPDALWELVEPFLPIPPGRPKGGRPRVSDRACLTGTVFVLRSGIPWQMLPPELGCGSGMTCWRRLHDWQRAGVWDLIHSALLDWLARSDQIDWSRAVVDSCSIRAVYGGDQTGPNPTDRAKRGSKRHLICDGRGVPLAVRLTGANRNDSQEVSHMDDPTTGGGSASPCTRTYLRPFPEPDQRWQVSTQGGTQPVWNPNGREISYRSGDKMMVVSVSTGPEPTLSDPKLLSSSSRTRSAPASRSRIPDISADGQRFVMVKQDSNASRLNVVLNWSEELKRLVPAKYATARPSGLGHHASVMGRNRL